ncbi:dienelactone hydrolase family protein [Methylovirgula sp. 4M-Z18]|uniref:dienelactone hydrolase family protein n=1 Tax=Methylovirgula sp. 4M-Z18 TaxID=2293567 RepID=UPI000E2EC0F6|nr:dienelactone hydrolase family protein [Methylovirgula sp. 4M-Z18]RFB79237.1 dienelactone hydrolase family protein [Methylovirgula sp. 4M-Z18]
MTRSRFVTLLFCLVLAAAVSCTQALAGEFVTFNSAAYRVGLLQQRAAQALGETALPTPGPAIRGYFAKPDGTGPFAAVVVLHGCGGGTDASLSAAAQGIASLGYAALAVDSFTTRGIREACDRMPPDRLADAAGALAYLAQSSDIDPKRIALLGFAQGGSVTLSAASAQLGDLFALPGGLHFKAAIAFYPDCHVLDDQFNEPGLIMIGDADDWASVKHCQYFMARRAGRGAPVQLIVYPGAYHAFDVPALGDGVMAYGHWLKYDAAASAASERELVDFLKEQLAP